MAAMGKGKNKDTLPWEVIEMGLCERLHCLPSQLAQEDIGAIIRGMDLLDLHRSLNKKASELTLDEKERIGEALELARDKLL